MFPSTVSYVFGPDLSMRTEVWVLPVDAGICIRKANSSFHNVWLQADDLQGREKTLKWRKDPGRRLVLGLRSCLGKEGSREVWSVASIGLRFTMKRVVRRRQLRKRDSPWDKNWTIGTKTQTQTLHFPLTFGIVYRERLFRPQTLNTGGILGILNVSSRLTYPLWAHRCRLPLFLLDSAVLFVWRVKSRNDVGLIGWWITMWCFSLLWRWVFWRELGSWRCIRNKSECGSFHQQVHAHIVRNIYCSLGGWERLIQIHYFSIASIIPQPSL